MPGKQYGILWSGSSVLVRQLINLVAAVVLARLLLPGDYGLVALVFAANALVALFSELGITLAVVNAKSTERRFLSSLFWINLGSGFTLSIALALASPAIARFFDLPQLGPLIAVAGLQFTLSFGVIHRGLLRRQLQFREIAKAEFASVIGGSIVAVMAAIAGLGAWSLVAGSLVATVVESMGLWRSTWFSPALTFSATDLHRAVRFSAGVVGFNFVTYWSRNFDTIVIGRTTSAGALGEYNRAYNLMMFPILLIGGSVERVMVPRLSSARGDVGQFRQLWLLSVHGAWSIALVLGLGLYTLSMPLVAVLYGANWLGVVEILSLLAIAAPAQVLARVSGLALQVESNTDRFFFMGVVNTGLTVVGIASGSPWGAMGVARGILIASYLSATVTFIFVARRVALSPLQASLPLLRTAGLAAVSTLAWALGQRSLPESWHPLGTLLVSTLLGAVIFSTFLYGLDRSGVRNAMKMLRT